MDNQNSSFMKLQEEVNNLREEGKSYSPIRRLILEFPVPSDKEDLLDFIVKMEGERSHARHFTDQYKEKWDEAVKRAMYLFPEDSSFAQIFKQYEEEHNIWCIIRKKVTSIFRL